MKTLDTIRTFKTKHFTLTVKAVEDFDLDLSWDDDGSVRAALESGEFQSFGVVATLYADGHEIAEDSLWGCIYESPAEFMDHVGIKAKARADGLNYGSYFSGMVRNVITEGRKELSSLAALTVRA